MDQGTFRRIKTVISRLGFYRKRCGQTHSDGAVLAVYFWAALCDRPVSWACDQDHWPPGLWRAVLPSQSCMSRRMHQPRFAVQQARVEAAARPARREVTLVAAMDGKPLPVAWHSTDPHAGKGRGAGCLARGYKIHALVDAAGGLLAWRLASLNVDERAMAPRLLRQIEGVCYIVADSNYDSLKLFEAAHARGAQLVAPRQASHRGAGLGHRPRHPARLRSIELLEGPTRPFVRELVVARRGIERFFANLTNFGGGLTCLPAWVRTYPRTLAWVAAKLTIAHLRQHQAPADDAQAA